MDGQTSRRFADRVEGCGDGNTELSSMIGSRRRSEVKREGWIKEIRALNLLLVGALGICYLDSEDLKGYLIGCGDSHMVWPP